MTRDEEIIALVFHQSCKNRATPPIIPRLRASKVLEITRWLADVKGNVKPAV